MRVVPLNKATVIPLEGLLDTKNVSLNLQLFVWQLFKLRVTSSSSKATFSTACCVQFKLNRRDWGCESSWFQQYDGKLNCYVHWDVIKYKNWNDIFRIQKWRNSTNFFANAKVHVQVNWKIIMKQVFILVLLSIFTRWSHCAPSLIMEMFIIMESVLLYLK